MFLVFSYWILSWTIFFFLLNTQLNHFFFPTEYSVEPFFFSYWILSWTIFFQYLRCAMLLALKGQWQACTEWEYLTFHAYLWFLMSLLHRCWAQLNLWHFRPRTVWQMLNSTGLSLMWNSQVNRGYLLFWGEYQKYFISCVENINISWGVKIRMFSTHDMKYSWYLPKKVNFLFILCF